MLNGKTFEPVDLGRDFKFRMTDDELQLIHEQVFKTDENAMNSELREVLRNLMQQATNLCNLIPLGIYEHYKGGRYVVTSVGRHESDGTMLVSYTGLENGMKWHRPVSEWVEQVPIVDNKLTVPRFKLIQQL